MPEAGTDLAHNRDLWTVVNAQFTDQQAERSWAAEEITWGLFQVSEHDLGVLGDVDGLDVVELGCGTAYLSGWLARRGARPVGVDLTPAQLDTAARCQERFGLVFPLVEANAENVPLPDGYSTWWSASTAPASGATPSAGLQRRRGCCARAGGWCS